MSFYNEKFEYLTTAIQSILDQTYKDFNFIIVSDNPQNKQLNKIVDDFASLDRRILFIKNEKNIGLTSSLNRGLNYCNGDYVVRMDADDYSFPVRLEKQVEFMDLHPTIVAAGCYARLMDGAGDDIGEMHTFTDIQSLRAIFPFRTPIYHPSAIIRRVISNQKFYYDENYQYSQDYALWYKIIENGISNVPEYLIKYRVSEAQISQTYKEKIKILDLNIRKDSLKKYYSGISDLDIDILMKFYYELLSPEDNKIILSTLQSLYKCNVNNDKIAISSSINYLYFQYCKYLSGEFSFIVSLYYALKAKRQLNIKTVKGLASIILSTISKIRKRV